MIAMASQPPTTVQPSVIRFWAIASTPMSVGKSLRASTGSEIAPAIAGSACVGR